MHDAASKRRVIALGVTGSIAAYKAVEVARLLLKQGHRVMPMMTSSATRFVGPVTLSGITGERVLSNMWDEDYPGEMHITIAREADLVAIVPATADVIARLAEGRADDLVTATALSARGPVLLAPSMHPRMWSHPATARNVETLRGFAPSREVHLVGPVVGPVASGEIGMGRMAEPAEIVARILGVLDGSRDLEGLHVVVSAGPTHEPVDPVRFLGNRSSGKMGFAIAARAAMRGARVTLVAGPVTLATPDGVTRVDVETAEQMRGALARTLGPKLDGADALVMAAAVADFRPAVASSSKIKKDAGSTDAPTLTLARNPDLVAEIAETRAALKCARPILVAFALETGDDAAVLAYASDKLKRKRVDVIVANAAHESLGRADNRVALIDAEGASPFEPGSKDVVADRILDRVVSLAPRA